MAQEGKKGHIAKVSISGAGVLHVRSAEILKTREGKRQIKALRTMKQRGLLLKATG